MELNIEGVTESAGTIGIVIVIPEDLWDKWREFPSNEDISAPRFCVRPGDRSISLGRGHWLEIKLGMRRNGRGARNSN